MGETCHIRLISLLAARSDHSSAESVLVLKCNGVLSRADLERRRSRKHAGVS